MKKIYDIETLTALLDISPQTLELWEDTFGIISKQTGRKSKEYNDRTIDFLKKVKLLTLNDFSLEAIKELLSLDLKELNNSSKIDNNARIIDNVEFSECPEDVNTDSINEIIETKTDKNIEKSDIMILFKSVLDELKRYTERTIEAEKKIYLLEDHENRIKQDYCEVCSELRRVKLQLDDKEQKLKDYDEQKKRMNLLEVQLKIMQIEKSKKKFWEFWK